MQYKSDLVTRCQELMDLVKEQERELSAEVRSVYKDAEQVIEAEKKNFRSGYEDRLQKVSLRFLVRHMRILSAFPSLAFGAVHRREGVRIQRKHRKGPPSRNFALADDARTGVECGAAEYSGRRAVHPGNLVRQAAGPTGRGAPCGQGRAETYCQGSARQVIGRCGHHKTRASQTATAHGGRPRARSREAPAISQGQGAAGARQGARRDAAAAARQPAEGGRPATATSEAHREPSRPTRARGMDGCAEDLFPQLCLQPLPPFRMQIQALRRQAQASSKNHQTFVRKQLQRGTGEYDDSDNEYRSSPPGKSKSTGRHSPSKISHSRGPNSTGSLHLDGFSDDEGPATTLSVENTAEEEIEIAAVVRAGQEERDKQLQAEIRALESETIRLERQWRARAEAEEKAVLATVAVEEDYLQVRRQRSQRTETSSGSGGAEGDVAELVVLREQLIQQLQEMKAQSERAAQEEQEVSAEIRTYREGVAAHKARISDKQEQHRLHLRELQLEAGPKLRELREQVDYVAAQIKDGAERCRRQVVAVDKEHAVELAKLDSQVRILCQQ